MNRRRIVLLALAASAVIAALLPWTVRSDRVAAALARQIKQGYGVALTSSGTLTFTLLPMPQLVLTGVRLASADGVVEAEAGELRSQLRLLPLLQTQLRLHKVWLAGGRVTVTLSEEPVPTVAGTLSRLRARLGTEPESRWIPRIDRFIVTDCDITIRDRAARVLARFGSAALVLHSPEPDGALAITASARWNGEQVIASMSGLNLAAIREGRSDDVEGEITTRLGRATISGRLAWSERPLFSGSMRAQAGSLGQLTEWSGIGTDLAAIDRPSSLTADGSIDLDQIALPKATIEIGRDTLDGAMAVEFGERPQVRGTLAGGDLDLAWLAAMIGAGKPDRTGGDYDIRLSATSLTLWAIKLRDAALSLQSGPRGTELSLGRAGFAGGILRGRVSATLDGEKREMRALAWADGVDLERALGDVAGFRGLSGTASGQLTIDLAGDRNRSFASQLRGRGSLKARDGEIANLVLVDAARRAPQGALPPEWRGGKVRFNQLGLAIDLADGSAELGDGLIETAGARALLAGRVDLETAKAALRLTVQPQATTTPVRPPVVLELTGPLARLDPAAGNEANALR